MPGPFAEDGVRKLQEAYAAVLCALRLLREELLVRWLPTLTSARAQEYLQHGVCRRLGVIARAIENIFNVCPPDRIQVLESDARHDIEINLHAFVIVGSGKGGRSVPEIMAASDGTRSGPSRSLGLT